MARNGALPDAQLVTVQGTMRLTIRTAYWWRKMKAAAAADRVHLSLAAPAGCYRSLWTQRDMHLHPERYNLNPASTAGLAPVGASGHGWGDRIDVIGPRSWLKANGARFGFSLEFPRTDPNHYRHNGKAVPAGIPKPPVTTPANTETEDDEMKLVLFTWLVGKVRYLALAVPGTSYFVKWTEGGSSPKIFNAFAAHNGDLKGTTITASLAAAFEREADRMLPAQAGAEIPVRLLGADTE